MNRFQRLALIAACSAVMLALVIFPERFLASVSSGLKIFAVAVLPALFPFFFFSKLLTGLGAADGLSRAFQKPMSRLFRAPPETAYIFFMSLLSGYPVGAKLISDFYSAGVFSEGDAKRAAPLSSTSGPLFIVGAVGASMLVSEAAGYVMLAAHYLGALINALFYRGKKVKSREQRVIFAPLIDGDRLLSDSINGAVLSVAAVGGFIAVFSVVVDLFSLIGVFSAVERIFDAPAASFVSAVLVSLIEMTRGCVAAAGLNASMAFKAAVAAFAAAFGGLSVLFQSHMFLSKCKIKFGYLALFKITQAAVTALLTLG
ncbi:MAG TPA: hypothetical protein PK245_03890, partial [Clostridia bacterium]|nr:hypothetical protein [Clostridia bacterium]